LKELQAFMARMLCEVHAGQQKRQSCERRRAAVHGSRLAIEIPIPLEAEQHHVGKENTQKIESKHINLRTWIKRFVRRTMGFAKTACMHDLVIGLCLNRYAGGRPL